MSGTLEKDNGGGEGGGTSVDRLILKRSELAIIRRMADKYPILPAEREEIKDIIMATVRDPLCSPKTRVACAKAIAIFDKINHDEFKLLLDATGGMVDLEPAQTIINNQVVVNNTVTPVESVLHEYADVIQGIRVPVKDTPANGTHQSILPPQAPPKTS